MENSNSSHKVAAEKEQGAPNVVFTNAESRKPEPERKMNAQQDRGAEIPEKSVAAMMRTRRESGASTRYHALKMKVTTVTRPVKLNICIRMFSRIATLWEFFISLVLLTLFWLITYSAVFAYYDCDVWMTSFVIDCILLFDTTLRLTIEIWRQLTKTPCQVFALQYSFWQFLLDVVSLAPLEGILAIVCGINSLSVLNGILYSRFNRVFRLIRSYQLLKMMTNESQGHSRLLVLFRYLYEYSVIIQFFVCCMYLVNEVTYLDWALGRGARIADEPVHANWLVLRHDSALFSNEKTPHHSELYLLTLEFIVAICTTTGFGDVYPFHISDMVLSIIVMIIGAVFVQGSLGSILTEFHLDRDVARFDLFFRLKGIEKYLKEIKAPPIYTLKLQEYYRSLWNYREGVFEMNILGLSLSMQEELMYDICEEMFHTSPLFHDLERTFLQVISKISKVNLYIPDMILCQEGTYSTDMHYIIQGELRVRGKYDPATEACILRPGSIVGEVNLLFSYPALTTIETNSVCQILTISKSEFVRIMDNHPAESEILRQRLEERIMALNSNYQIVGYKAVSWVQRKESAENNNSCITLRDSKYFNAKVYKDIPDDSRAKYIANRKCISSSKAKDHYACYRTCTVESVFSARELWVKGWTILVITTATINAFMVPYCRAFDGENSQLIYCQILNRGHSTIWCVFVLDLIVELYVATPSTGLYFRFKDGLSVSVFKGIFWIDAFACTPDIVIELVGGFIPSVYNTVNKNYLPKFIRSVCKAFKILRFLRHLDNVFPLNTFLARLLRSVIFLLYGVHFIACVFFTFVCHKGVGNECSSDSWLNTYYIRTEYPHLKKALHEDVLAKKMPFLCSLFFASAILTSAGYGDFAPQKKVEILVSTIFMVLGIFLFTFIMAGLTSALSCGVRPKLVFHQKLLAIRKFMEHHHLTEITQNQVIEHYVLQNQNMDGILLPSNTSHLLYDAPKFMAENTLLWEVEVLLEGVPLFTKCETKILTRIARSMKRFVIPPNLTYVERGEVRRQMSVIAKGSVSLLTVDAEEKGILETTGHFGIRDLLFGEPQEFFIKTKSYCLIYTIDFQAFIDAFEGFEDKMMEILFIEKTRIVSRINDLVYVRGFETHNYDKSMERPVRINSFIFFPWRRGQSTPDCTHEEYKEMFNELSRDSWFFKLILMPITIHPVGTFAKAWTVFLALVNCVIVNCVFIENFVQFRFPLFRIFQIVLDCFNWTNVYLKLHWCYYGPGNILISHPVRTASHYIYDGLFPYDVVFGAPFELLLWFFGGTDILGYGPGSSWFSKFRMIRCFQLYRVPELFRIVHSFFRQRTFILVVFYAFILASFITLLGTVAIYIACPTFPRIWVEGDEYRLPACIKSSWMIGGLDIDTASFGQRYVAALYYVVQCICVIGFGDIIVLQRLDMQFIMVVTVFGFLLAQIIISDMTAAQVDTDEVRAKFQEERRCLLMCLSRERVPRKIQKAIGYHMNFVWDASRGLQPRELFQDLHPALASNIFQEFVGQTLKHVPLFQNFSAQVLRSMSQLLKKQYFLKGERITRFGQLEFEMFIIAEGRVYMVDGSNNYVTTLKEKDFFGELAMLYGKQRRHSALAATKVELFVLNADDFAELIEKYPAVREEILTVIKDSRHEVFVQNHRKKKKKNPEKWKRKSQALSLEVKSMLKDMEVDIFTLKMKRGARKFRFKKWICGYGPNDHKLPFLYFAAPSYNDWRFKFLIHPNCGFWVLCKRLIPLIHFMVPIVTMYDVFFLSDFKHHHKHIYYIDWASQLMHIISDLLEAISFFYMLLNFIVPFKMGDGQYCKVFGRIVLAYVTRLDGFIMDFIGCIPVDFINDRFADNTFSKYLSFIKFIRLFQFYRAIFGSRDDLNLSALRYKLAISGSTFFLIAHTMACLFHFAATDEKGDTLNDTWMSVVEQDFEGMTDTESEYLRMRSVWYIRSIYYVMAVCSSCGFGDNLPQNFTEYILVSLCIIFGFFSVAIVVGNITTGLTAIQKAKREYFYKVRTHVNHLQSIGLSKERQDLMMSHYAMQWDVCRGQPYHKATAILPLTMQFDCCALLFGKTIKSCNFFGDTNDQIFVRNVASRLIHSLFLPGVNIINQGDSGNFLYIVYKGVVCSYLNNDETGVPEFKRRYHKCECFGRIPCLFKKVSYSRNYRAETEVEILQLDSTDILHIVSHYPHWLKFLKSLINTRYPDIVAIRPHIFTLLEDPNVGG